jgi:tetrachlorobenzoquinone reductase
MGLEKRPLGRYQNPRHRLDRTDLLETTASDALTLVLTCIRMAARDTNLYTFERPDRGALPPAEPGAHIGVLLPNGIERQYSLVEAGSDLSRYTVGVKRDANSRGGSVFMHDQLRVGSTIQIVPPRNNFPLIEDAERVVLIAGGIGITPIYCMIQRLRALARPWELYYACRTRADAAFLEDLAGDPKVHLHFDDEEGGRFLNVAEIINRMPKTTHLYCCGPAPMIAGFEAATEGWPKDQIHIEYFTPKFTAAQEGGFVVELARSKRELVIPSGKSILQCIQEAGIQVPHSCEEGVCGACETRVISGIPDHRDSILTESERKENATMMICCSGAKTPRLVLDI